MLRIEDSVLMERKLVNGDGVDNLSVSEFRLSDWHVNKIIKWNGSLYEITYLALQEYVGEKGSVKSHQEEIDTTELYFSLGSTVTVQLGSNKKRLLNRDITNDSFINGMYTLVFNPFEENTPQLAIEIDNVVNDRVIGTKVMHFPAIVIQPGIVHSTSWEKKKDGNNPLFLVVKLKLMPPEG